MATVETPKKVEWYYVDIQWLRVITGRVYGREYDLQMGERSNGEYDIANTDPEYQWNDWPGEYEGDDGDWAYFETVPEAIAHWLSIPKPEDVWARPEWQPAVWAVLSDLADKGEIPHGEYFISIDW